MNIATSTRRLLTAPSPLLRLHSNCRPSLLSTTLKYLSTDLPCVTAVVASSIPSSSLHATNVHHHRRLQSSAADQHHHRLKTNDDDTSAYNPLHEWQTACRRRNLCNEHGHRSVTQADKVQWTMVLGTANGPNVNLKTVGVERLTDCGIDFVTAHNTNHNKQHYLHKTPASVLQQFGQYGPGQTVEVWRGEGTCEQLELDDQLLELVPRHVLANLMGTARIQQDGADSNSQNTSDNRTVLDNTRAEYWTATEIMAQARRTVEDCIALSDAVRDEAKHCMTAIRWRPHRVECLRANPDESVLWHRWEWKRMNNSWTPTRRLAPH